jgi:acetyltransferase-like isoleucine patch superfamily enzyme
MATATSQTPPATKPAPADLLALWRNGWAVLRARWYLRRAAALGPRVRLWGRPAVTCAGTLLVGDRARLVSTVATLELAVGPGATLAIGERTFINYGTSIAATERVEIGPHCSIGTYVVMMDNDFHSLEPERRDERPESRPIVLEENVWLGARVVVLRGVRIGAGSVVAAGSVVTHDIPPRSLAAGMPAKVIRKL